ncbi:MAG: hypothetical protein JNN04_01415, partial [Cyclobacteriaceae bacterium]|nr:hypothetical protein [Cyclobacteriaceae bacterium]
LPDLTTQVTASTNCAPGLENGVAEVLTVDGTAVGVATGYTYVWTGPVAPAFPVGGANNSTTAQLIKVQGGAGYDYTVLVTNQANGCQTSLAVNVNDAKVLPVLTLTPQPNTICDATKAIGGAFDGQVQAVINNIPGGSTVNDYFFNWSVGADGNGVDNLPGLDVGNYSVTALHNITGCQSIVYTAQVTSAKTLPAITMAEVPSTNCAGGAPDGVARVTNVVPNGKTYDYRWFDGNSTASPAGPVTLASALTTNDYTNVQGGIVGVTPIQYTVEVLILETGCSNTATVAVSDDSEVPVLGPLTPTDNTNCGPVKNGEATVSTLTYRGNPVLPASFGDYTFTWSGGTQGPPQTITAAAAGAYTLTAQNNISKCTSNPVSVTIQDNLFIPVIDIVDVEQTSCNPLTPNGSLTATINEASIGGGAGVTAGYTFTWIDDVTAASTGSNAISNLKGDQTYTITAFRDATQCSRTQTIYLGETLTVPTVTVVPTHLTICVPPNGSLTATPSPASAYTFFWYNGNDAPDEDFVINNFDDNTSGATYSGLIPGDYTVVVRDNATQCRSNQVITAVLDNSPKIFPVAANANIPTDCNTGNGALTGGVRLTNPVLTFSALAATDQLTTSAALGLAVNDPVSIKRDGVLALPLPLEENKIYFIKTIAGNVITLSLTAGGATIDLTADGNGTISDVITAGFTFEWYAGVPSPTDPLLGSINYFTNPPVYSAGALSASQNLGGLNTGLYTLQATNTVTGCKAYIPHTLPFIGSHAVVKINKTNSTLCPYTIGNGSIEIQIEDPITAPPAVDQTDYIVRLFNGVTQLIPPGDFIPPVPVAPFVVTNTLAPGSYVVEVEETYSGSNCKIFQDVIIDADALPP